MTVNEIIYDHLYNDARFDAVKDNIYFNYLPRNYARINTSLVYTTEVIETTRAINCPIVSELVRLQIKVISTDAKQCYSYSILLQESILEMLSNEFRDIEIIRNVFNYDAVIDRNQVINDFDLYLSVNSTPIVSGSYSNAYSIAYG